MSEVAKTALFGRESGQKALAVAALPRYAALQKRK